MREVMLLLLLGALSIVSAQGSNATADPLFPPDIFSHEEMRRGYVLLYLLGMDFMFIAVAFANDHFVVAAVEVGISKITNPNIRDIVESIIIPLSRSFAKFTIGWMGIFLALSDIGIATVVGSITFHSTITIACFFFTNGAINIYWPNFIRDFIFYILSVIMFIAVLLNKNCKRNTNCSNAWDWGSNVITMSEALVFPLLFVVFIIAVVITGIKFKRNTQNEGHNEITMAKLEEVDLSGNQVQNKTESSSQSIFPIPPNSSCGCGCVVRWMLYIRMLVPSAVVWFSMFCLDPKRRKDSSFWPIFIIPSIVLGSIWVVVGSYLGIWWSTAVGENGGIPPEIMGFVVLAVYVSIPTTAHVISRNSLSNLFGELLTTICVAQMLPAFIWTLAFGNLPSTSESLVEMLIASIIFTVISVITLRLCSNRCARICFGVVYVVLYFIILIPLYVGLNYGYIPSIGKLTQ